MDPQVLKKISGVRAPFTKELVDGFHMKDLARGLSYFEGRLRSMFRSLEDKGYVFDKVELVDPLEFYNGITKPGQGTGSGTKEFEIAKNSFYGIRVKHHFRDPVTGVEDELKCPLMFLPFTNKHGDLYVRGSLYGMQYVLSERGPSVDGGREKTIFVRVTGYRFKVPKELHAFNRVYGTAGNLNTASINMTLPANRFYSPRGDRVIKNSKVPLPLLAWYIFGKYGFTEAMREFGECEYMLDTVDTLVDLCKEKDGWQIYANSGGIHPKAFDRPRGLPVSEDPAIAIRSLNKSGEIHNLALQYVGALLHMFGVFSHELDIAKLDDINYWRWLIGRCSIKLAAKSGPEAYLRQMNEHFASVEEYADDLTIDKYNKFDIEVCNTYDLFNYLLLNYSTLIKLYNPADMLHKELASMEFLFDHMIKQANDFKFRIRNKTMVNPKIINREIDGFFRLFNIDRSIRENNVCMEQTGTDNPFIDYALGMILQTRATVGRGQGKKSESFDPNHPGSVIDPSQPFVCSYQYTTKPAPDGRGLLSPRLHLIQGKYTALHPEDRELYHATAKRLREKEI